MSSAKILREGMRSGDLKDLVLPLISVDEYQSKAEQGDGALVFGFYVHDKDAAKDLTRFIQKSPVSIIDSEVSEAPDAKGYFMVFVDFEYTTQVVDDFISLVAEIEPLTDIDEWNMQVRGTKGTLELSKDNLKNSLLRARQPKKENALKEIGQFLQKSALEDASIEDNKLLLTGDSTIIESRIDGFGKIEEVMSELNLLNEAVKIDFNSSAKCRQVERMLGENWNVTIIKEHLMLHRTDTNSCLIITPV